MFIVTFLFVFFFKQKTAYEMRISDWSSDVCSSDLKGLSARRRFWGGELPSKSSPRLRDREDLSISRRGRRDRREKAGHLCDLCGQIGRASCRERVCQYV